MKASESARPFEFLSMVLIRARKAVLARLGSEAGDALDALLEASLSYEESHSSSLAGFATWFASEDTEIKRNMERGSGEVRLMTVHGAKGLESSIVILPDTTSTPKNNAASALMFVEPVSGGPKLPFWRLSGLAQSSVIENWKDKDKQTELEEQRRLLYVAMTRARDELYVCGYKTTRKAPRTAGMPWSRKPCTIHRRAKIFCAPWNLRRNLLLAIRPGPNLGQSIFGRVQGGTENSRLAVQEPNYPDSVSKSWPPARLPQVHRGIGSGVAVARGRAIHKILQELPQMAPDLGLNFARRILAKNRLDERLAEKICGLIVNPEHQ